MFIIFGCGPVLGWYILWGYVAEEVRHVTKNIGKHWLDKYIRSGMLPPDTYYDDDDNDDNDNDNNNYNNYYYYYIYIQSYA